MWRRSKVFIVFDSWRKHHWWEQNHNWRGRLLWRFITSINKHCFFLTFRVFHNQEFRYSIILQLIGFFFSLLCCCGCGWCFVLQGVLCCLICFGSYSNDEQAVVQNISKYKLVEIEQKWFCKMWRFLQCLQFLESLLLPCHVGLGLIMHYACVWILFFYFSFWSWQQIRATTMYIVFTFIFATIMLGLITKRTKAIDQNA